MVLPNISFEYSRIIRSDIFIGLISFYGEHSDVWYDSFHASVMEKRKNLSTFAFNLLMFESCKKNNQQIENSQVVNTLKLCTRNIVQFWSKQLKHRNLEFFVFQNCFRSCKVKLDWHYKNDPFLTLIFFHVQQILRSFLGIVCL